MKFLLSHRRSKPVAYVLLACHVALGIPSEAAAGPAQKPVPEPQAKVTVNRTVPAVSRAPLAPVFSARATDAELFRARIFEEPLLPLDGEVVASENQALVNALRAYLALGGRDAVEPLQRFLSAHPQSRWRASLLMNMGLVYRRTGHLLRALRVWEEAWELSKSSTETGPKAIADRAIGELFELNASLGRYERLEELFLAIDGRDIRGSATEKVSNARQALWLMHNRPGESFRCGPLAIDQILRLGKTEHTIPAAVEALKSTKQGTSLLQVKELADAVGLSMRMARREPGAHIYVPSVLHWRAGHFAAIVDQRDDMFLVRDATFASEMWVRQSTLDEEASGFFVVPDRGVLLPGWLSVDNDMAATVWGKGILAGIDNSDDDEESECPEPEPEPCAPPEEPTGMPAVSLHMLMISVKLRDIPVGYTPPVGPGVGFRISYHQREAGQPQTFTYGNLGPKWSFNWMSFIEDDPTNPAASVTVYRRNGGREPSTGYNAATQSYAATARTQAVVVRTSDSPIRYERRLASGTVEVFEQPDGALTFPRRVFLTAIKDRSGNTLSFTWDSNLRLVAATDAIGQVTTVSYDHSDPLKITKVTDPFGRFATFTYDASGRLQQISDVLGLTSSVTYGLSDLVKTLTTPYGTTTITAGEAGLTRWAEVTDPLGGKERAQYTHGLVATEPTSQVPVGMSTANYGLNEHNTLYWDKNAMASGTIDATTATDYLWALKQDGSYVAVAVPLSVKKPLENRVWFNYHGGASTREGTIRQLTAIGRVLDDGSTRLTKYEYNSRGRVTKQIDPLGRETVYEYDTTALNLLTVKQKNAGGYDLLEERTLNSHGLPLTVTDAAGETTTYTYNTQGQVLTVTNAKSETMTLTHTNGYLTSATGPVSGATATFAYDGHGRLRTPTGPDGYAVTVDYDALNRVIRVTYPDATYEQVTYRFLDRQIYRDRLGRQTHYIYDSARRLSATIDPLHRTLVQEWGAGGLDALVDASGNRTRWEYDLQGRVTKEVRADASAVVYTYETTTSRLKRRTDARGQHTDYTYFLDGRLKDTTFPNAVIATPTVSFTYDAMYGRLTTMVDGTGTTAYTYKAAGTLGAGQVATLDGPLSNDTLTYTYDELGRLASRTLNGVTGTWTYDALDRLSTQTDPIGTFTYAYDGQTDRLASLTYPNGQTSSYSYFGNTSDRRLSDIHHRTGGGATLSRFQYTYDVVGNIVTWTQHYETDVKAYDFTHDVADQLTSATYRTTGGTPTILKRNSYGYDPTGNRTNTQVDDVPVTWTYDALNRLTARTDGGLIRVEGTVNEPATVTIQGKPASVDASNRFTGTASLTTGTTTRFAIMATDGNGNFTTEEWETSAPATSETLTYDSNGNLTSRGTKTYEWNARNQLVRVLDGVTELASFVYDGFGRRTVKTAGGSTRQFVYGGEDILEERVGLNVERHVHGQWTDQPLATVSGAVATYYLADHLGSIVQLTDSTAAVISTRHYDPYGLPLGSTTINGFAFTGREWDSETGLYYYRARYYDASLGRFISADPAGFVDGPNVYSYVLNAPALNVDPSGRQSRGALTAFGETGGLYPQQLPRPPGAKDWSIYDHRTWDPKSYQQLQEARQDVAKVRERNSVVHERNGSGSRNPIVRRAWRDCVAAANNASKSDLPPDVRHFFLRQEGEGPQYKKEWFPDGKRPTPYRSYGPFVNPGGGDVPKGSNTYIDFYRGVK